MFTQFSVIAANKSHSTLSPIYSGKSVMYITNSSRPSTLPCEITMIIGIKFEYSQFTPTLCFVCSKNALAHLTSALSIPYEPSLPIMVNVVFSKSVQITDNLCWGANVLRHSGSWGRKFQGTKVIGSKSSGERKFHLWNFPSRERKYVGTFHNSLTHPAPWQ